MIEDKPLKGMPVWQQNLVLAQILHRTGRYYPQEAPARVAGHQPCVSQHGFDLDRPWRISACARCGAVAVELGVFHQHVYDFLRTPIKFPNSCL